VGRECFAPQPTQTESMTADPRVDTLKALVAEHLPEARRGVTFQPIRTGKFNRSYYVTTSGGQYVLRIAPPPGTVLLFYERDMMRQEPRVHEAVLEHAAAPVPRIIAFDDSRKHIDRMFLIMERMPGTALSEVWAADYDRVLHQVGSCLARVHAIQGDKYGYVGPHKPMEPQETWCDAFRIMWSKLVADIEATGHYSREEGEALRRLLDRHLEYFKRDVPACLLHMDIWSQNLLVDSKSNLTAIVDWDRALWGDPEIEFAVLDYCGISEPAFWKGYGVDRDTSSAARLRGVFYFLYELQKYIVIRHGRNRDPARAASYKRNTFAVLDGAFGSTWRK